MKAREREHARERREMVAGGGGRVVVALAGGRRRWMEGVVQRREAAGRERELQAGAGRKKRVRDF